MLVVVIVYSIIKPTKHSETIAQIFQNQYMKIELADGWVAKEAQPQNSTEPVAVNITKGNYILYINTKASQASGVQGGRFAEIAMGSPSADAVISVQPNNPCGSTNTTSVNQKLNRVDLFVSPTDKSEFCNVPSNSQTVWYFSYVNQAGKNGYFNYDKGGDNKGYVITMSYNSANVNEFPEKNSDSLAKNLSEMSDMVKTLEIKPL